MEKISRAEIELKFPLQDPEAVRSRLLELGFVSHGRLFESNVVLDTPALSLASRKCLLRLRRDSRVRLTFKEPHAEAALAFRFKAKEESELELSDFDTMRHILHCLGFSRERTYEKYREHFTRGAEVSAELDRLPHLGYFLELEAPPERIEELAPRLGFDLAGGLKENYFELFNRYCLQNGLQAQDLRFEDEGRLLRAGA